MSRIDPLFAKERQEKILHILETENKIVVPKLAELFGVSATTIRKDLTDLQEAGKLLRTHGGAISISKTNYEELPVNKESIMLAQKQGIAHEALERIEDGDTIALLTGTTVFELVKILNKKNKLTVVVNDLRFALFLEQNTDFSIYMLSGIVRNNYHYITSPMNSELLSMLNIDKAFITCNGFTLQNGATTPDFENALKIREVLSKSSTTYLLCDSSKIGLTSFAQIAETNRIDCLITDDGISEEDLGFLSGKLQVITARTDG